MWYNPLIASILRSPLHGMLSGTMLLMTVTGRKSGKPYTLPVNYVATGEGLLVLSQRDRTWWRNLRGGAPVQLVLRGKAFEAQGEAIEDEQAVIAGLTDYLQGLPQAARYLGVSMDSQGQPSREDVAKAAASRVMVRLRVD